VSILVVVRNLDTLKDTFIMQESDESFCTIPLSAIDAPSEEVGAINSGMRTSPRGPCRATSATCLPHHHL